MSTTTLNRDVTLKVVECGTCGVPFALSETMWNECYNNGGYFYCPMGHCRGWDKGNSKSAVDKLKDELKRKTDDILFWQKRNSTVEKEKESYKNRLTAQKGQTTKLKKRIANGVCPCCNRSFSNLHRHITSQHPEFAEGGE